MSKLVTNWIFTGPLLLSVWDACKKIATVLCNRPFRHKPLRPNVVNLKKYQKQKLGQVTIIGAGPGDPELLTVKAHRLLQEADVVLYDWLVSEVLLNICPAKTIRQFVGKRCGEHSCQQETICNLMVEHARLGRKVVRLKGGDPSVFGRVSEECLALQNANISFAIVPGITSATGMAAYAGLPLTDRRYAQSVRFITASLKNPESEPDWSTMVSADTDKQDTLVFYMGLRRIDTIVNRLLTHGMPLNMPIAVIDKACHMEQQRIDGTLGDILAKLTNYQLSGPALIVVGKTAAVEFDIDRSLLMSNGISSHYSRALQPEAISIFR